MSAILRETPGHDYVQTIALEPQTNSQDCDVGVSFRVGTVAVREFARGTNLGWGNHPFWGNRLGDKPKFILTCNTVSPKSKRVRPQAHTALSKDAMGALSSFAG